MLGKVFAYFLLTNYIILTSNYKMLLDFRLLLHLLIQFALIITKYKQITSVTICANYVTNRKMSQMCYLLKRGNDKFKTCDWFGYFDILKHNNNSND